MVVYRGGPPEIGGLNVLLTCWKRQQRHQYSEATGEFTHGQAEPVKMQVLEAE